MSERKPSVFISYSHNDVEWKNQLVRQLQIPARRHGFEVWHDGQIQVGDDWRERIGTALESTQIAVLLISDEFLNSEFINTHEVPLLLDLRKQGRVEIVPVLVGACLWQSVDWLERLELRPKGGEPLEGLSIPAQKKALVQIAGEIDAKLEQAVKRAAREQARAGAVSSSPPEVAKAAQQPAPPSVGPRAEPMPVVVSRPRIEWPAGVTPRTFEFEVVAVDERGKVVERRRATNDGYVEDLGGGVTLEMMAIPGGTFLMGSPDDEAERREHEGPVHAVTVASFFIGRVQVTQEQWCRVATQQSPVSEQIERYPSHFSGDSRPVEKVSWAHAGEFCARLSRWTGRAYRLPSEAEWEYAARAGTEAAFHFGPTIAPGLVNYDGNMPYGLAPAGEYRQQTVPVGSLGAANFFGLCDMHGNVWEWVQDSWHADYIDAPKDGVAWDDGADAARRVVRGGSWDSYATSCRSAARNSSSANSEKYLYGFRVVFSVVRC